MNPSGPFVHNYDTTDRYENSQPLPLQPAKGVSITTVIVVVEKVS